MPPRLPNREGSFYICAQNAYQDFPYCACSIGGYHYGVPVILGDPNRFQSAIDLFDRANAADPTFERVDGVDHPRELLNARRLTDWVLKLCPDASEELQLAARSQHLCRWEIPRNSYPQNRVGYLQWRTALRRFHAQQSGEIMRRVGYPDDLISRVQNLNLKLNFPQDPESRILEDALCLVFLEHQLADLAAKTSEDKVINALRKSWQKMTQAAQMEALKLNYGEREKTLIEKALR